SDLSTVHPLTPASHQLIQSTSSLEVFIARPTAGTGALSKPNCREGLPDFGVNRTFCGLGIFQAGPGEVVHALEDSISNAGFPFPRVILKYEQCAGRPDEIGGLGCNDERKATSRRGCNEPAAIIVENHLAEILRFPLGRHGPQHVRVIVASKQRRRFYR